MSTQSTQSSQSIQSSHVTRLHEGERRFLVRRARRAPSVLATAVVLALCTYWAVGVEVETSNDRAAAAAGAGLSALAALGLLALRLSFCRAIRRDLAAGTVEVFVGHLYFRKIDRGLSLGPWRIVLLPSNLALRRSDADLRRVLADHTTWEGVVRYTPHAHRPLFLADEFGRVHYDVAQL